MDNRFLTVGIYISVIFPKYLIRDGLNKKKRYWNVWMQFLALAVLIATIDPQKMSIKKS